MAQVSILGHDMAIEYRADGDEALLEGGVRAMVDLINGRGPWLPDYEKAFTGIDKIVFFRGSVEVNGWQMSRPCCDEDDRIFYWEVGEFLRNMDADVHGNTFFHDCWHLVQYKAAGNQYAYKLVDQVNREVDAINHQIGVAHLVGCSTSEIKFLEDFRDDQRLIVARLDEGVNQLAPHKPGEITAQV